MISDADKKAAFRIAYDFMERHQPQAFSTAFFNDALEDIRELHKMNKDNTLLKHLLVAIYEYYCEIATEDNRK